MYTQIFLKKDLLAKQVLCKNSAQDVYCKKFEDLHLRRIFHVTESLILVTKYTKKDDFDFDKSLESPHIEHGLKYIILE